MQVATIGLDLAKNIFHVCAVTETGEAAFKRSLRRAQVLALFERLSSCLIGIEGCASSHHWGREIMKLGQVTLVPSQPDAAASTPDGEPECPNPTCRLSLSIRTSSGQVTFSLANGGSHALEPNGPAFSCRIAQKTESASVQ